jgi:cytochrome c oxidase cbb3-type subunit 1
MWRAVEPDGTLTYSFVESVKASYPYYYVRLIGGLLYFTGMLIMAWNVFKTIAGAQPVDVPVLAVEPAHA